MIYYSKTFVLGTPYIQQTLIEQNRPSTTSRLIVLKHNKFLATAAMSSTKRGPPVKRQSSINVRQTSQQIQKETTLKIKLGINKSDLE
jgi:hypothetical protein